jgi:hypothetical protein
VVERRKKSVFGDDRAFPVEFVVHAEQHGLYPLPGQNGFAGRDRAGNPGEVLGVIIFEEDVVETTASF